MHGPLFFISANREAKLFIYIYIISSRISLNEALSSFFVLWSREKFIYMILHVKF